MNAGGLGLAAAADPSAAGGRRSPRGLPPTDRPGPSGWSQRRHRSPVERRWRGMSFAARLPAGPARGHAGRGADRPPATPRSPRPASLLAVVLEQGAAIRERDVQAVVRLAGILRGEMGRRQLLEEDRGACSRACGERLGIPAQAVTLGGICTLIWTQRRRARQRAERRAEGPAARAPARALLPTAR